MANLLLLGLDGSTAENISKFAIQAGHSVRRESMRTTFETRPIEDVIVLSGDQSNYRDAISSLRLFRSAPPVIVVCRLGETSNWLDALESGALDFLSAPYTSSKIRGAIQMAIAKAAPAGSETALKTFAA